MARTLKSLQQAVATTAEQGRMSQLDAVAEVNQTLGLSANELKELMQSIGLDDGPRERRCGWDDP